MPCYHPLDGKLSPSGKFISRKSADYGRFARLIKLPCGRCIGCKLERSNQWSLRLMHEAQQHEKTCFITLTYADWALQGRAPDGNLRFPCPSLQSQASPLAHDQPHTREKAHAYEDSLSKRDAQLFTKRLNEHVRTKTGSAGVRYYLVGEYGEKHQRPHYHAIVYGEDFYADRIHWKTYSHGKAWRSATLEKLWPYGHSEISDLTIELAAYAARYVTKKITGEKAETHYLRTNPDGSNYWIEPEFAHMSRRPGIAKDWIDQYMTDVYPHDYVVHKGAKKKPPRYYDTQLKQLAAYETLLGSRPTIETIKERRETKRLEGEADNTPERLRVKEHVQKAALAFKKRNLE